MGYTQHWFVRPGDDWNERFDRYVTAATRIASTLNVAPGSLTISADVVTYRPADQGEPFVFARDPLLRFPHIPTITGDWYAGFAKTTDPAVTALLAAAKIIFEDQAAPLLDGDDDHPDPAWQTAFAACAAAGLDVPDPRPVVGVEPEDLPELIFEP